ncbi:MAG: hypothetical protein M3319_08525 [Actinomycetota bacterium]|nr:hypothetical protein [Actinomycetota bacterium]
MPLTDWAKDIGRVVVTFVILVTRIDTVRFNQTAESICYRPISNRRSVLINQRKAAPGAAYYYLSPIHQGVEVSTAHRARRASSRTEPQREDVDASPLNAALAAVALAAV